MNLTRKHLHATVLLQSTRPIPEGGVTFYWMKVYVISCYDGQFFVAEEDDEYGHGRFISPREWEIVQLF